MLLARIGCPTCDPETNSPLTNLEAKLLAALKEILTLLDDDLGESATIEQSERWDALIAEAEAQNGE